MNNFDLNDQSSLLSKFASLRGIITDLKSTIDQLMTNFESAKHSILELAKKMDEIQLCERREICRAIKDILKDKIGEGKITAKWIEDCLPEDYKRKYTKSEETSQLKKGKRLQKMLVDNRGISMVRKGEAEDTNAEGCPRCSELEEALSKTSQVQTAEELSGSKLRIPIPKDKYEELKSVIKQGSGLIHIVIDKTSWSFVRFELISQT